MGQRHLDRCPQAVAVLPDVIDGDRRAELAIDVRNHGHVPQDRTMPIWHMHEPIFYLLNLCEGFSYVGIGSSGEYASGSGPKWQARMTEVFAAIDQWEAESNGAFIRPRIHMMRSQGRPTCSRSDSSDSTNVAVNHGRQLKKAGARTSRRVCRQGRRQDPGQRRPGSRAPGQAAVAGLAGDGGDADDLVPRGRRLPGSGAVRDARANGWVRNPRVLRRTAA